MNTILLYHGVTRAKSWGIENYSGKHMPVAEFRRQMEVIATDFCPVSLTELSDAVGLGHSVYKGVAVTFDDSYKNAIDNAVPILEELNIPATFFIATGYPDMNRRYWTDWLEHIYNVTSGDLSEVIRIKKRLKTENPIGQGGYADIEVAGIAQALGCIMDNGNGVLNYRNMSWDDVRELDKHPLFDVGGHTVNHAILSHLTPYYRRYEINGCLERLEKELGHPVDLFSYPEGQVEHFNDDIIADLKAAGVVICPTAIPEPNLPGTDPFHLRRYMPGFEGQPFPLDKAVSVCV